MPATACSATDFPCLCAAPGLWKNATACGIHTCTIKEALAAQNITAKVCHTPVRDKSMEIQLIGPILCLVAIIFVIIRIVAREPWKTSLFGWDDAFIIGSTMFATPAAICQIFQGRHGLGKDIWTVPFDRITTVLFLFYVSEIFYLIATVCTRISILLFYRRVFPIYKVKLVTKWMLVVNVAFCISFFFPLVFQCSPISHAWTRWSQETGGKCIDLNAGGWSLAAINIVLDLAVLTLPLPILFGLQLTFSWQKKMRLFLMFSSGLIVTVVSVLRLRTLIVFAKTHNPTWDYIFVGIWSAVELFVGIICACLPMAKVFFTRVAPAWLGFEVDITRAGATGAKSAQPNPQSHATPRRSRALSTSQLIKSQRRASSATTKSQKRISAVTTIIAEDDGAKRADFVRLRSMSDLEMNKSLPPLPKEYAR